MSPLNFPASPTTGQVYTTPNGVSYRYNGTFWNAINTSYAVGGFSKLDDISSHFNGSNTTFSLTSSGVAVSPLTQQNLNIVLGGIPQEPGTAYTVSGGTITFTEAPTTGTSFYGVLLGDVMNVGTPSDQTVSFSKLDATLNSYITTAAANTVYLQGALNQTNSDIVTVNSNISYLSVVNSTQNTNIQSAWNAANVGNTFISSGGSISGNVAIGTTSTSGYRFLISGYDGACARLVTTGRADLTLTSSGVISYDIGTNTDSSFSVRQNGTTNFLSLKNNGNYGIGSGSNAGLTTGTGNISIGRDAGTFITSSNNNIVVGDALNYTNQGINYVTTVGSAQQTIIGDTISEVVYPTYTAFNGTYALYDFALNSTTGGLYELSTGVNTNAGGSGFYRSFQHSYVGCNVNWGGNGYGVYVTNGSLYNHNGTNVNAVVIYNSSNNTEYVGSLYVSGTNYLWTTSGIFLRIKLTNFNTSPQYIGSQKVILRKKITVG